MRESSTATTAPGGSPAPSYPVVGTLIRPDAVDSLLPRGLDPRQARVLAVHAHPDDETLASGLALASLAAAGAEVHLVTMTRGERGEVVVAELAHLEVGHPGSDDDGTALGAHREHELAAACRALGVRHHVYAGQAPALDPDAGFPGGGDRYLDSGMSWGEDGRAQPAPDVSPRALTSADPEQAAAHVAAAIRALRPHAAFSYDDDGGYGHPDHVRTAQVLARAAQLAAQDPPPSAGSPSGEPQTRRPQSQDRVLPLLWAIEAEPDAADERPQAVIRASDAARAARRAAMRAHATQIVMAEEPSDAGYALSNGVTQQMPEAETYRLLRGFASHLDAPDAAAAGDAIDTGRSS